MEEPAPPAAASAEGKAKMEIDITAELAFLDELAGDPAVVAAPAEAGATPVGAAGGGASTAGPADAAEPGPAVKSEADVPPTVEAAEDGARGIKRERDDDAGPAPKVEGEGAPPEDREVDVKKEEGGEDEDEESLERDAADLIDGFRAGAEESAADAAASEDALKTFLDDMRAVDRSNEVERILWAFKLNPYDKLGLRFTATESEVRKQYRKISLLIHPDKCKHPLAADAFEVLGNAQKEVLDAEKREVLMRMLEYARDHVRQERTKSTKHDPALRLAATLHADGREGVEREWEETQDFHDRWRAKAHDVLARAEFRRRKLIRRSAEEEARLEANEKEAAEQRKKTRQDRKEWLQSRGSRIESWRDWANSGKKVAGTKAPKLKTMDTERSYVQRAVTEQFVGNYRKKPTK